MYVCMYIYIYVISFATTKYIGVTRRKRGRESLKWTRLLTNAEDDNFSRRSTSAKRIGKSNPNPL